MYGCDCDGVTRSPLDLGIEGVGLRAHIQAVKRVTGHEPPTCPWRAFYDQDVRDVLAVSWAVEGGNLTSALGPDPDHRLMQGMGVYRRAVEMTRAEETRIRLEEEERKRKAQAAARGGRRG